MSDTFTLKFPTGQFTHSELAVHNNRTNQQVWAPYQKAIKDGIIVFVGLRTGKGKPSKLFQVAGPDVVAATDTTKVIQTVAVVAPTPKPAKVETVKVETVEKPTVSATNTTVLVAAVTREPEVELEDVTDVTVEDEEVVKRREVEPNVRTPENMTCPVCGKDCIAWDDATGVMVQCNQPIEVCACCENPYGHGRNEKVAYEVLCQKYGNRK